MTDPAPLTSDDHRRLAAITYNDCWDLLEGERDDQGDRDLVGLALTSRYHWIHGGGGHEERAIADWMASRCFAAVGSAELSLSFARSALHTLPADAPPWLASSIHEGLARAYSCAGESAARDRELAVARTLLADEPDVESRELIESQLDDVP